MKLPLRKTRQIVPPKSDRQVKAVHDLTESCHLIQVVAEVARDLAPIFESEVSLHRGVPRHSPAPLAKVEAQVVRVPLLP